MIWQLMEEGNGKQSAIFKIIRDGTILIQSLENKHLKGFHSVRRIFAKWGYSTYENRDQAEQAENITPITLDHAKEMLSMS